MSFGRICAHWYCHRQQSNEHTRKQASTQCTQLPSPASAATGSVSLHQRTRHAMPCYAMPPTVARVCLALPCFALHCTACPHASCAHSSFPWLAAKGTALGHAPSLPCPSACPVAATLHAMTASPCLATHCVASPCIRAAKPGQPSAIRGYTRPESRHWHWLSTALPCLVLSCHLCCTAQVGAYSPRALHLLSLLPVCVPACPPLYDSIYWPLTGSLRRPHTSCLRCQCQCLRSSHHWHAGTKGPAPCWYTGIVTRSHTLPARARASSCRTLMMLRQCIIMTVM